MEAVDLESNKEPMINAEKLPKKMVVNLQCGRLSELRIALEVLGIISGIGSFVILLWMVAKK